MRKGVLTKTYTNILTFPKFLSPKTYQHKANDIRRSLQLTKDKTQSPVREPGTVCAKTTEPIVLRSWRNANSENLFLDTSLM